MCIMTSTPFRAWNKSQQRLLFKEKAPDTPAVHLPTEVRQELRQPLTQWMQQVTQSTRKEDGDE